MAGGFGGDDEEFEEENLESPESEEEQDQNDENGKAEEMNAMQKLKFELEEKVLRNKLIKIQQKVIQTKKPFLGPIDQQTMKKAKAHPKLKPQTLQIDTLLLSNKAQWTSKILSVIAPAIPFILIGLLILIVVIAAVAIIANTMPWLFGGSLEEGANSAFGVSGEKFYGVRTIYKDEEQARANLLENYVGTVTSALGEIASITSIEKEGTHTIEITILDEIKSNAIALPSDYDYATFDEEEFKLAYPDLWIMTSEIVDYVYKQDNNLATIPENTTLTQKLDAIKYFGFDSTMNESIKSLVENYVETHYSFTADSGIEASDVDTKIDETLTAYFEQNNLNVRAEKLFVKDFVFEEDNDRVTGIKKENYVQMIFMPKRNVSFNSFAFSVSFINEETFEMKLMNNGEEIILTRDDGIDTDSGDKVYSYTSNKNLNIQSDIFVHIDTANLTALKNETSFFDLLSMDGVDWSKYLVETTDGNEKSYLTWQRGLVYLEFDSDASFICVENETIVK